MSAFGGRFADDFRWGAATASYQIEGAAHEDGRGESIWDRFCRVPGAIADGSNGDVACDHYHLWAQDVALMKELGLDSYRFSIAWPRIFPEGYGKLNKAGLDFYGKLVDGLLAAGITPFATIYHWDLPQALQDKGGWANRDTAAIFADYADTVVRHLSDRVPFWITHNEPAVSTLVGHLEGRHAPGLHDPRIAYQAVHNMLLSHGLAMKAIRASASNVQAGITLNLFPVHPATAATEDVEAARVLDGLDNRLFLDPIFRGRYPDDIMHELGPVAPAPQAGDMETIAAPIDFLGVNYYRRKVAYPDPKSPYLGLGTISPPESEYTQMGWEVYPDGLREMMVRLHKEYGAPAYYITENGAAFPDIVGEGGQVRDNRRIAYLESHVDACARAIAEGVPLKGYFVWSLMDNFEWGLGYSRRFGIVYVDYPTEGRIMKESGRWYQEQLRS